MFRITKKADYAVFILAHLARKAATSGLATLVSAQELASFSALNKSLIANLLKDLTKAGILGSVRGARGGYHLARPAAEISLEEVLHVVEGPFTFVECAHDRLVPGEKLAPADGNDHENCDLTPLCGSRGPLLILHARISRMLKDLSLAELSGIASCASVHDHLDRNLTPVDVETANPLRSDPLRSQPLRSNK